MFNQIKRAYYRSKIKFLLNYNKPVRIISKSIQNKLKQFYGISLSIYEVNTLINELIDEGKVIKISKQIKISEYHKDKKYGRDKKFRRPKKTNNGSIFERHFN